MQFLSTPSARRATADVGLHGIRQDISIHALCEEGDFLDVVVLLLQNNFYPRPLRGGRLDTPTASSAMLIFLSTPSARRATRFRIRTGVPDPISIHALCEEGDRAAWCSWRQGRDFYPRPLRGGRRDAGGVQRAPVEISIHALCEEGDPSSSTPNSRTSRFLSTPSARRATSVHLHP